MPTASEQLARFACQLDLSDVPQDLIDKVKEHILDTVGVTLLGASVPVIAPVREYALAYGARGRSRLAGPRAHQLDAEDAAIFNGTAAMATEMDNHHLSSGHPCSIVPACLAVAEEQSSTGADFLLATIVAYEITSRVGMATTTSVVFDRGFHNAACYNGFGVSAGAALLMGMTSDQLANALAIAGAQASGVAENARTATGRFHAGIPAANGIRAARLAKLGLRGAPTFFEGSMGYLRAFSAHPRPELLTEDLGEQLIGVIGLRLKMDYSSVGNIAPQIEALHSILTANSIHHSEIKEIRIGGDPLMVKVATEAGPPIEELQGINDLTAGHYSTHMQLAITAVKGRNDYPTLLEVAQSGYQDPDLQRIAHLVTVTLDPECEALFPEQWLTKVTVVTTDGGSFEDRAFAMGEPDAEEKFRTILEPVIPESQIDAIIDRVNSLETLQRLDEITELLETPAA